MLFNTTPIQMEWFCYLWGDKTKLNWFLLEVAMEYYGFIMDSPDLAGYREQYGETQIAQFCAYYARRMKESLLNHLRGRRKSILGYPVYIDDFYPHHDEHLNNLLGDVAAETWKHLLSVCKSCPQRCLQEYEDWSPLFDEHQD